MAVLFILLPLVFIIITISVFVKVSKKHSNVFNDFKDSASELFKKVTKQTVKKCEYCGTEAKDNEETCKNCGSNKFVSK